MSFRIGPAETYDVIAEPAEDRAYAILPKRWIAAPMHAARSRRGQA